MEQVKYEYVRGSEVMVMNYMTVLSGRMLPLIEKVNR
jgi:hypothetical protein